MSLLNKKTKTYLILNPECTYKSFKHPPSAFLLIDDGIFDENPILIIGTLKGTIELINLWSENDLPKVKYGLLENSYIKVE